MNFLADESVDHPIVERLRDDGHDVLAVAEMAPGMPDETVLAQANQRGALLLTGDKDFGELVFRQHRVTAGVVLVRLAGVSAGAKAEIVSATIRDHGTELLHAFTVISPGMVRIRPRLSYEE
jgi:predicted nuclease of predicted toxin-antitoxin system